VGRHCVDAVNALHVFMQPFLRTASRLQDGRAQFTLGRITFFSEKMFADAVLLIFDEFSHATTMLNDSNANSCTIPVFARNEAAPFPGIRER